MLWLEVVRKYITPHGHKKKEKLTLKGCQEQQTSNLQDQKHGRSELNQLTCVTLVKWRTLHCRFTVPADLAE